MVADLIPVLGGVGLFLFGMVNLTDGLKSLTSSAVQRVLSRFTTSPVSGAVTGALTTAVVQSSSATTVAAVGFVGAGLLTFPQALGVIFGANIGTTITGWVVALVGFKLDLGVALMPLILAGALMKLFGRARLAQWGVTLAGFGILFVGLDLMQSGMAVFEGQVTPDVFPDDTLFGRLQLLLIGVLITLITQSSSAGVATAMVALGAGAISFPQAAAMIIGMDVGTTATAALAALGGSTSMRRTGFAHVIYNCLTGVMAFCLLPLYVLVAQRWLVTGLEADAQFALVAFHTLFNMIGVLAVLPFTRQFTRLIMRLVPETGPPLMKRLDDQILGQPGIAVDAALATVEDIFSVMSEILVHELSPRGSRRAAPPLTSAFEALEGLNRFVERIETTDINAPVHARHLAVRHCLDHLGRLSQRLTQEKRMTAIHGDPRLSDLARDLTALAGKVQSLQPDMRGLADEADRVRGALRDARQFYREQVIKDAAAGAVDESVALPRVDGVRWLHRVAYHLWRILFHLSQTKESAAGPLPQPVLEEQKLDVRNEG